MIETSANLSDYLRTFACVADELDGLGRFVEANVIDEHLAKIATSNLFNELGGHHGISKKADLTNYITPAYAADALKRVIYYMMYRAKVQNRDKFLDSVKRGLIKLNPVQLSMKKMNPGSAIGSALNMIRGVLTGQFADVSEQILDELRRTL